jgi:hypothetical protein
MAFACSNNSQEECMSTFNAWIDGISESVMKSLQKLADFVPNLLGAVAVLIVGWILALFISRVIVKVFKLLKFDYFADKLRIDSFLAEGGVNLKAIELVDRLIYWLLMLCVVLAACDVLGMKVAAELLDSVIAFIPKIVIAIVVLLIGAFAARVAQGGMLVYLKNVGVEKSDLLSKLTQYAILAFTVLIVLEQLKIAGFIVQIVQFAFAGLCLAFGLAFGLGGKDWASGQIQKWFGKK